jgi:plasmid maintenance system antidote protein VapI
LFLNSKKSMEPPLAVADGEPEPAVVRMCKETLAVTPDMAIQVHVALFAACILAKTGA